MQAVWCVGTPRIQHLICSAAHHLQDVELLVYLEGWSDQQQQCEDKHGQLEGQQQQPEGQQQQSTGKQQQPGAQQQQEERPMEVEPSSTEAGGPAEGPAAAQLGLAAAAAQAAADPYDAHFSFHAQGFRQTGGWPAMLSVVLWLFPCHPSALLGNAALRKLCVQPSSALTAATATSLLSLQRAGRRWCGWLPGQRWW